MNFLEIYSIEIKISQNESVNSKTAQNKLFKLKHRYEKEF